MSEFDVNPKGTDPEIISNQNIIAFKTIRFIESDLQLSLLYFGLILFLPLMVLGSVEHSIVLSWQVGMFAITCSRWLCRFAYKKQIHRKSFSSSWNGLLIFLTLMDGVGWGVLGTLLVPADSVLTMSMTALLLIGVGGLGAASYSSRMLVAIPYLLCVISPFTTLLYLSGSIEGFFIASGLSLLTIMFCYVADQLNLTLNAALSLVNNNETILSLENEKKHLENIYEKEKVRSNDLQDQVSNKSHELETLQATTAQQSEESHFLAGQAINLLNNLEKLKITDQDNKQHELILKIKEDADHISSNLKENYKTDHESLSDDKTDGSQRDSQELKRILIVNNDHDEREKIEACLQSLKLSYKSVENAPAALVTLCEAEANNHHFDLIIANMWMPDMDGINFAECLQDDPDFREINIIMMGAGEVPAEEILLNAGINLVLNKPLVQQELVDSISHFVLKENEQPTNLPAPLETMIDNAIKVSLQTSHQGDETEDIPSIIDKYTIDGLRSSTTTNFIEIVNDFLEEAPLMIDQAIKAHNEKRESDLTKVLSELGGRSLHMGAIRLVESTKTLEKMINENKTEMVLSMLQSIDAELLQVEAALLTELSHGALLVNVLKH